MPTRRPITIALIITIVLLSAVSAVVVERLTYWNRVGWAGMNFLWGLQGPKPKTPFPMEPGTILLVASSSPAARAGVKIQDRVISINGIAVPELRRLQKLDRTVKAGDIVTYRIARGKTERDVPIRFESPLNRPFTLVHAVITAVIAAIFLGIGLLVLLRRPDDRRARVFYGVALVGTMSLILSFAGQFEMNARGITTVTASPIAGFMMLIGLAFAALGFHLALVFPRERPIVIAHPYLVRWIYSISAFGVLLVFLAFGLAEAAVAEVSKTSTLNVAKVIRYGIPAIGLGGLILAYVLARKARTEGVAAAFLRRPLRTITVVLAFVCTISVIVHALGFKRAAVFTFSAFSIVVLLALLSYPVLTCIALYRSYRDANLEEKRQVKWPLWGTFIALSVKILVFLIGLTAGVLMSVRPEFYERVLAAMEWSAVIPRLAALLIPISFAVAIFKYRLMNIDVIIRKTVVYAMLSAAIVVLYLGLVGVLGMILVNMAGVKNQTMIIGATLVVALVFVPMRNKLQTLVDRNLFRHKYDYPEALRAISAEALAATNFGAFLTSAAEKTQQALQNRAVVIFTTRHDEFIAAAKVGVPDSLVGTLRLPRQSLLAVLDRPFDPRRHSLPENAAAALKRIDASLVVPINAPGTPPNGFLALAPKLSGAEFDVEDSDFLRSIGDQLDVGIDRIRLQREDADYSQAREIQQSLLPREMPKVVGLDVSGVWQSARTMGGDYFDVLKLSETELAICIGDVAGKGMPAALLMSGLQAAVRASASSSPRDLCERVRRVVVSSLSGGRFVTFFYATIDTAAMRLRWSNAGHNAPILARPDGSMVRLSEGGPAISRLFRDTPYEERELALGPGDRLVLFTDGVSEASDRNGEQFGEHRIEELVAGAGDATAEQLQQTIVGAAAAFSNGDLEDDVTLVVVRLASDAVPRNPGTA